MGSSESQPPTRRERRQAERKAEIYRVAMTLFVERGFADVRIEEIAEASDIAKGTFFNYFPTKESLLIAYREELFDSMHEYARTLIEGSARDRVKKYFRRLARLLRREGDTYELLFAEVVARPHLLSIDGTKQEAAGEYFLFFLRHGKESGEIAPEVDLTLLVDTVRDVWTGTSTSWLLAGRSVSLESQILRKIDFLFDLIAPTD